jgi:hypothetical protein
MGSWDDEGWYINSHKDQFDGSLFEGENCTPTAVANGADAATTGVVNHSGGWWRSKLPRSSETDPQTAGWSIPDADRACMVVGVGFVNSTGQGPNGFRTALAGSKYVILQGMSWVFSNATCSGDFNGPHCIGIHPRYRIISGVRYRWIDDGICEIGRWEKESVILNYGSKISSGLRMGYFTNPVIQLPDSATSSYRVYLAPRAKIRTYNLQGTCIKQSVDHPAWGSKASSAPCMRPVRRKTCDGTSAATTVLVTKGMYAGKYMRVGALYGVTVEEV